MAEAVYILCALTSVACSVLLLRGWLTSRTRLLFWSSLCFGGLAANNILLFIDLVVVVEHDLAVWRSGLGLMSVGVLIFGLIWESEMKPILDGALAMGCWVVALFFLRFWRTSRDRLFLFFSFAFMALCLNWLGLALANPAVESRHLFYLSRLVAFSLIIVGILDKNRRSRTGA